MQVSGGGDGALASRSERVIVDLAAQRGTAYAGLAGHVACHVESVGGACLLGPRVVARCAAHGVPRDAQAAVAAVRERLAGTLGGAQGAAAAEFVQPLQPPALPARTPT